MLKIKGKVTSFQTRPRPLCDKTRFKFEGKISKVNVFTKKHTDDTVGGGGR